jgi:hypothetical protein
MKIDKIRLTVTISSDRRPVTQKQTHNTENEDLESILFEWVCVAYWFMEQISQQNPTTLWHS